VCELIAREYADCFGLNIVLCRFFSLFGVRQRRLLVWEIYEQLVGANPTVWLQGTGAEARDYLSIEDVWSVFEQLIPLWLQNPDCSCVVTINVAAGVETYVSDLAKQIRDIVAPGKAIRFRGLERAGDPRRWRADLSLLTSLLPAWRPEPLSSALPRCIAAWLHSHAPVTTNDYQPS
jgi:nucleoside-diphosphate-sugar epimerase